MAHRAKAKEKPRVKHPVRAAPSAEALVRVGRRNVVLFAVSLAVIIVGFVALALGSTTLAPILLVAGYLVGIPWAILARDPQNASRQVPGPSAEA